ncbi:MAG: hypothetical protein AABW67_04720 [Nanoarchaeota archaeon]
MRSFKDYFEKYKEFYEGILELAKIEDEVSKKQVSHRQEEIYQEMYNSIMSQCPAGTNIEDLIGLVVVGKFKNKKI